MEEKEKKIKNVRKKIIKKLPNLKEVNTKKDADIVLIINKNTPNNYDMRLNDFTDKDIEVFKSLNYEVVYLKNTNHHDKRLSSIGFINRF